MADGDIRVGDPGWGVRAARRPAQALSGAHSEVERLETCPEGVKRRLHHRRWPEQVDIIKVGEKLQLGELRRNALKDGMDGEGEEERAEGIALLSAGAAGDAVGAAVITGVE
jgi:hypothetical protein